MNKRLILTIIILSQSGLIFGQTGDIKFYNFDFEIFSEVHDGDGTTLSNMYSEIIDLGDVPWVRIKFKDAELGQNSYIMITSLSDGYYQNLNSVSIEQWSYSSAYFNGGLVKIDLFVDKFDKNVNFSISNVYTGIQEFENITERANGICGEADDRQTSNHKAIGRILTQKNNEIIEVCTGWISSLGKQITASHCFDYLLSNYCLNECVAVLEFNVPYSNSDGTIRHPEPEFQFVVNKNSIIRSNSIALGNDWAIFEVYDNTNTIKQPIQTQNSSIIVYDTRNDVHNFSVIGFGVDGPPPYYGATVKDSTNHTQQKAATQLNGSPDIIFDGDIVKYKIDAHSGNSGGPIIDDIFKCAVGIHNRGECKIDGYNKGTSVSNINFINNLYPTKTVFLNQVTEQGNIIYGLNVNIWKDNSFQATEILTSPVPIIHNSSSIVVRADTNLFFGKKYRLWMKDNNELTTNINIHRTIDLNLHITELTSRFRDSFSSIKIRNFSDNIAEIGGFIHFKDPWLIDYPDPDYVNAKRNRGMKNEGPDKLEFKQRTSPFYPDYATDYNGDVYKGVFLDQGWPDWTPPYYSVKSESVLDTSLTNTGNPAGRSHRFYFRNWSADTINGQPSAQFQYPNSLTTPVVFRDAGATVQANLKGTQLTNNTNAFTSNSQRKCVRTPNGQLANIYESLGTIWLENSTNNGQSWFILNNANPLETEPSVNPAIDYFPWGGTHSYIAGVYYLTNNGTLKLKVLRTNNTLEYSNLLPWDPGEGYPVVPSVALSSNRILVVSTGGINGQNGLVYFYGTVQQSPFNITWTQYNLILPGTGQYSSNPTITANKSAGNIFHIAWQEGSSIKYCKATGSGNNLTFEPVETPSTLSGYQKHQNPSISLVNGYPILSWTGVQYAGLEKVLIKDNDGTTGYQRALIRRVNG